MALTGSIAEGDLLTLLEGNWPLRFGTGGAESLRVWITENEERLRGQTQSGSIHLLLLVVGSHTNMWGERIFSVMTEGQIFLVCEQETRSLFWRVE
jgi:hypothetical protein